MAETIAGLANKLNDLYEELGTWERVGKQFGVSRTVAWRIAKEGYDPKNKDVRSKMGLPEIVTREVYRNGSGRFATRT